MASPIDKIHLRITNLKMATMMINQMVKVDWEMSLKIWNFIVYLLFQALMINIPRSSQKRKSIMKSVIKTLKA